MAIVCVCLTLGWLLRLQNFAQSTLVLQADNPSGWSSSSPGCSPAGSLTSQSVLVADKADPSTLTACNGPLVQ